MVERTLRRHGWRFLGRRLQTRWGELDLLFLDGEEWVVIEVKTGRAGRRFRPGMRFGIQALERRWRAVRALAGTAPGRVDLFEVVLDERGEAQLIHHRSHRDPL